MKEITKITWDNELRVEHTSKIEDKKNSYYLYFHNQNWLGAIVNKKDLINLKPFVQHGTWKNTLFLPKKKYDENPEYWIKTVIDYRRPNDSRKWLKTN